MRTELKEQSPMTPDYRERNMGYPLGIFKRITGSMNTMSISTQHLQSLTTMGYHMLITLLVVTTAQLCLVFIMVTPYYRIETILLPVVIAINVLSILKILHTLIQLSVWLQDVSKVAVKTGQDNLI